MSAVQRWAFDLEGTPRQFADGPYVLHSDHERVVAELREAHEKALAPLRVRLAIADLLAPRTLTAAYAEGHARGLIDARAAVIAVADEGVAGGPGRDALRVAARRIDSLIHDSGKEATPRGEECPICGHPLENQLVGLWCSRCRHVVTFPAADDSGKEA